MGYELKKANVGTKFECSYVKCSWILSVGVIDWVVGEGGRVAMLRMVCGGGNEEFEREEV